MPGRLELRRWRPFVTVALALYVFFLAVSPFEHHDILCHLKTPQHCTSCTGSALGSDPHPPASTTTTRLADAGAAVAELPAVCGTLLPASSAGRSPPLAASNS
jgi:hypothetical protein